LQSLVKNGWPIAGRRVVICGTGPLLLAVAKGLQKYGAKIVSIVEQAPRSRVAEFGISLLRHPAKLIQGLGMMSFTAKMKFGVWPLKAEGDDAVRRVTLTDGHKSWTEDCDFLACGFHLVPNVELPLAIGCQLENGFVRVDRWQTTSIADVFCAGEPTGIGGADCALTEGQIAGYAAAGQTARAEALFAQRASWHSFRAALAKAYALRPELKTLANDDTLLCRCEDVSLGRVRQFSGWREAKLLSRCGMGPCQGRVCGAVAGFLYGWDVVDTRPPIFPARLSTLSAENSTTVSIGQ